MTSVIELYDEHPINETQVLAALERAGTDLGALTAEDLFAHDQDHYGGLDAVRALAERAGITANTLVLDICAGLGGPARFLAHTIGCRVVGIDLNAGRTLGAVRLTRRVGLADKVAFVRGDAGVLPFADGSFEVCISQESFLHITEKSALFSECSRVLRPGGRLAFTDWTAAPSLGVQERLHLREGIAAQAIHSFDEYRVFLEDAGFTWIGVEDVSTHWQVILRDRLEMYRSMREDTVAQFGEARHRKFVAAYTFFVDLIESDKLGGGRFVATRS